LETLATKYYLLSSAHTPIEALAVNQSLQAFISVAPFFSFNYWFLFGLREVLLALVGTQNLIQ
jgi:hypothetical protein